MTEQMALLAPSEVLGIDLNMPAAVPPEILMAVHGGRVLEGLTPDEKHAFDQLDFFINNGLGYAQEMKHRPQTLYALEDSPSVWLRGYSTTTDVVTNSLHGSLTASLRA